MLRSGVHSEAEIIDKKMAVTLLRNWTQKLEFSDTPGQNPD
jgi:hypothetical protein